jgi:hypothetical protein
VVAVFARPGQVHAVRGPWVRTRSVSIGVPSMEMWLCPAIFAASNAASSVGARGAMTMSPLVEIVIGGGLADRVIDGQLLDPGAIKEPAQDRRPPV